MVQGWSIWVWVQMSAFIYRGKRKFITAMCLFALAMGAALALTPPERVSFEDDFLGWQLSPQYRTSFAGNGAMQLKTYEWIGSGLLEMTASNANAASRLHFGGVQSNDGVDFRNFMMRKNVNFGARFFLSGSTDIGVTVGFTGTNDPDNVLAAIYFTNATYNPTTWHLQIRRKHNGTQYNELIDTGFTHGVYTWTVFEIMVEPSGIPVMKINGEEVARGTDANNVPDTPMVAEFQLWNAQTKSGWSYANMSIDWWGASQDRQ